MKYILSYIVGMSLLLFSCETDVEIDIPRDESRLVINAFLEEDSTVFLKMSESRFSLSSEPIKDITGADVSLFENDVFVAALDETSSSFQTGGWYTADYRLKENTSYRLEASKEGYPSVEASMTVPLAVRIDDLAYSFQTGNEIIFINDEPVTVDRNLLTNIELSFSDPVNEENYYEVVMYQDGDTQYVYNYDDEDNPVLVDTLVRRFGVYLSTNDPIFSDGDLIEGDGLFFSSTFLFSDESFNGSKYTLRLNFEGSSGYSLDPVKKYIVFLRSLSREQYLYLKSLELQNETDGNPFAEPVPVFNNVVGGYGIFVGSSHDHRYLIL